MEEGRKERQKRRKEERIEEQELNLILNLKWVGFVKLDQIQLRRRLSFFASSHKSSYYSLSLNLLLVMFSMGGFLILIYDKYKFNFF